MRNIAFPIIVTSIVLIFGLGLIALLRFLNREWWNIKAIRWIAIGLAAAGPIGTALWMIGYKTKTMWLYNNGSIIAVTVFTFTVAIAIALPFSGFFNWLNKRTDIKRTGQEFRKIDRNRRLLLKTAAITFPTISASKAVAGMASAFACPNIYLKPIEFENLPEDLHGFRILHLSDAHLGIYKNVDDIEEVLKQAEQFKPDLTLFTGDIADDLTILPDTLRVLKKYEPSYGTFASLGNHEYYRGIAEVHQIFSEGPIPLLKNSGQQITVNNTNIFLGGIDDPRVMGRDVESFYEKAVDATFRSAAPNSFKIMMSHRPDAFDIAAGENLDLTLAGHTHGGQVGFNDRSVFSRFYPESYLWGEYAKESSKMYVSCGIGHWFPFRLGCPSEAPIIELTSV